jgi:hypothetical protein
MSHLHTTSVTGTASEVFIKNPYESHPSLTSTEAEVLWEYAKLAQHVKDVCALEGGTTNINGGGFFF